MISKGSLVQTPERVDGSEGDICVVVSDPYPEWSGGHETVDLYIARHKQVRSYYVHALKLLSE
mgnify:CR=1 FL=1|jgi:hypothetical protein